MRSVPRARDGERGSALVLALFLIVILTVMGLGLVLRTKVSMAVAATERPMTKNFYAADGAIQSAYARLQVRNPCAFAYAGKDVRDLSGGGGYPIQVNVERSLLVNTQRMIGEEAGGGLAGGGQSLVLMQYRLGSVSFEQATQSRRSVEAEILVGPTPPWIDPPCN